VLALKKYGAPVYVRHEIVHNRYVVEGLQNLGAVFIEELHEIPARPPHCPVVFSAHGVPKSVPADAEARNLFYLDATCPLVSKVHKQAMRHQRLGRHVLLIGHAGHPEVIGTMGQLPEGAVTLIETEAGRRTLSPRRPDRRSASSRRRRCRSRIRRRHPRAGGALPRHAGAGRRIDLLRHHQPPGRGEGGRPGADLFLVVGAPNSSNSRRLVEVAERAGAKRRCWCSARPKSRGTRSATFRTLGLSAGASAPEIIVDEIIDAFRERFDATVELAETAIETENFPVMRAIRDVELTPADMAFVNGVR
jgi:4-hydroxy-3-methylbut-2-enyl diphosphate reductase